MRALLIAVFFMSSASAGIAYVIGGSNLGVMGYPKPLCSKPFKPYQFSTQWEVDSFNMQSDSFVACVRTYVENAKNDIERIREAANEAVRDANAL